MIHAKKSVFIVLLILTVGILCGCQFQYTFGSGNGGRLLKKEDAEEFSINKIKVEPITSIDIDTRIADVELIASDYYYVEIDYLYWNNEPEYSLTDGKLRFDDGDSFPNSYSINFKLDNVIRIYLPEGAALERLNIENSSGNVSISGFAADRMTVRASYGNVKVKKASAVNAEIKLSSGTSEIDDFQVGDLKFSNAYGNAKFTDINTNELWLNSDVELDRIRIDMSSGNVTIDNMIINTLDLKNSYGNISCKDITAETFDADLSSGELDVNKAALKDIDVSNSYGDVTLNLLGAMEDYSIDLDTSYGNVEVEGKDYDEHFEYAEGSTGSINANLSSGNIKVTFREP